MRTFTGALSFSMTLIIDSHEDLATNIITFGRDYRRSAAETRNLEEGTPTPGYNGDTMLGWEDYQRGQVALVFATIFSAHEKYRLAGWDMTTFNRPIWCPGSLQPSDRCLPQADR